MSILLMERMLSGVTFTQPIRVTRDVSVAHIRPWVYLNGTLASGTFQCRVLQGATELAVSTIDFADINAAKTETYAHGYIRFDFDSLILHKAEGAAFTEYIFEFSMVGYSNDLSNYLAICREWDHKSAIVYGDIDGNGNAVNDVIEPAGYQIFEYRSY